MNAMFFDPELLKLWGAQAAALPQIAPLTSGAKLAKVQSTTTEPLPLPPPPPPPPPDSGAGGADAGTAAGVKPEPLAGPEERNLLTRLGLGGGGFKDWPQADVAALTRGLADMLRQPAPPRVTLPASAAPPAHRPQGGRLPIWQATPGNPYLRPAAARASRRRGLLDMA